jgi:hypothetical protein
VEDDRIEMIKVRNTMIETTLETLFEQAQRLSLQDRLRLTERLAVSLQSEIASPQSDWHQALRDSYGILKDDPIERPPQLPLEERNAIE